MSHLDLEFRVRRVTDDRTYEPPTQLPFKPGSATWAIAREPVPFLAASTTLLAQVAHPLVAAGVAQHSDYENDTWGRFYRTFDTILKLIFGDEETSRRMQTRLAKRHAPVKGTSASGVEYDASDPRLGMWVWATLIHGAATMYEKVYGPLHPVDRDRYLQEAKLFAAASGVPPQMCPDDWQSFDAYYQRVLDQDVASTPEADDVARLTFWLTKPPVFGHLLAAVNRLTASMFMEPQLREVFGLRWSGRLDPAVNLTLRATGYVLRLVPSRIRHYGADLVVKHDLLEKLERHNVKRRAAKRRSLAA